MAAYQETATACTPPPPPPESLTPDTFKPLLKQLVTFPDSFTSSSATLAFEHVVRYPLACTAAQVGSFLTALSLSGKEFDPAVVAASARVLRRSSVQVAMGGRLASSKQSGEQGPRIVDIVGTGGDGHDTFNVSTSAGIVAAGAGAVVCKHGNRASTSASGSADLLLSLACPLSFPPSSLPAILTPTSPFAFLFAALYHPAFAALGPLRKELPNRTLFNVLGPLVNPARPGGIVLGVFKKELGPVFAEALRELGTERALVVCGREGLDEISPAGETDCWSLDQGQITTLVLHPTRDFGLPCHPLSAVKGLSSTENAILLSALLSPASYSSPSSPSPAEAPAGTLAEGANADAITDFILLNTAAVLLVSGLASSLREGVELARDSMRGGGAERALEAFRTKAGEAVAQAQAVLAA